MSWPGCLVAPALDVSRPWATAVLGLEELARGAVEELARVLGGTCACRGGGVEPKRESPGGETRAAGRACAQGRCGRRHCARASTWWWLDSWSDGRT